MGGVDGERLFPWPFASKEEGGRKRPAGRHPAAHHCKLKGVRQHIALADGGGKRLPLQPWLAVFLLLPRLVGPGAISLRRSEERRVGNECVRTCRSRRLQYHYKHKDLRNI